MVSSIVKIMTLNIIDNIINYNKNNKEKIMLKTKKQLPANIAGKAFYV